MSHDRPRRPDENATAPSLDPDAPPLLPEADGDGAVDPEGPEPTMAGHAGPPPALPRGDEPPQTLADARERALDPDHDSPASPARSSALVVRGGPPPSDAAAPEAPVSSEQKLADSGYELYEETRPPGLLRRFFTVWRHAVGLVYGSAIAVARDREQFPRVRGLPLTVLKLAAFFLTPFVRSDLRRLPLQVQLRRRLEMLGPTYIKLGQVLALRQDLFPSFITEELKNLLDKLPAVPYPRYLELVSAGLRRPWEEAFRWIEEAPVGSASIGQIHRAITVQGERVIIKVVKPNIRDILRRDARLLGFFGAFLQVFFARYQPKRILDEFTEYTLREVDLRREADNAEQFALNFRDSPDIRFPKIYREYSSRSVMTMELFDGVRPDSPAALALPEEDRQRLVDLGAEAIIRMLYRDGFFHADLHAGNVFVLRGRKGQVQCGFIDLGMVGYFDGELRRTLMYYYYSLVTGDAENAARYLSGLAEAGPGGDKAGFRRAVAEVCRRFQRAQHYADFSLATMILESVSLGGQYRVYFPVEMVLMTKALVTFEGVGRALQPGFDVAKVSQKYVNDLFLTQFNPVQLVKESLRGAPELVDLAVRAPLVLSEAFSTLEQRLRKPPENPFAGLKPALLSGFSLVGGSVVAGLGGPWPLWVALYGLAALFALGSRKRD